MASPEDLSPGLDPEPPYSTQSLSQLSEAIYRPFDTVPPEILGHILKITWLSYTGGDSVDRYRFPSVPSQVNRYFNHTTMSVPILWSYLRVTSVTDIAHSHKCIHHRSGTLPLDLYLVFKDVAYQEAMNMVERTIMQCLPRYRTIALYYPESSILSIPPGGNFWDHLNLLREPLQTVRFSINGQHAPSLKALPPFSTPLRTLELSLQTFHWPQTPFSDSLEVLSIQNNARSQVTTAVIIRCLSGPLHHTLRSLSLSHLSILVTQAPGEPCVLHSLENLELSRIDPWDVPILLRHILTPNLRHLSMKNIVDIRVSPELTSAWHALRFPYLSKLTLGQFFGPANRPEPWAGFIQNLPSSVKYLEVTGPRPIVALFRPSIAVFCSQLHYIVTYGVPLHSMVYMVDGRCASLQRLEINFSDDFTHLHHYFTDQELAMYYDILKGSTKELVIIGANEGLRKCRWAVSSGLGGSGEHSDP